MRLILLLTVLAQYPITTFPKTPDTLPPSPADLAHYGRPSVRLSAATDAADTVQAGAKYAISFESEERGYYVCTVVGPTGPPLNGTCAKLGDYALDAAGKPLTFPQTISNYKVFQDGVQQPWPGALTKSGPIDTDGTYVFQTPSALTAPLTVGSHELKVTIVASDATESAPAVATFTVTAPTVDCSVPLGADAPSVFVTRWTLSGDQVSLAYQLASKTPILEVQAKVSGATVQTVKGTDLTATGALWFASPPRGTYKASIFVRNQAGCTREALSPVDLRVK